MSKFVRVKVAPQDLKEGEYVIHNPDFSAEIEASRGKRPSSGMLTPNYLREIIASIGDKYIGDSFDAMRINVSAYRGVPCGSVEVLNSLVSNLLKNQYPKMLELVIEHQLKKRPSGTRLTYFTGDSSLSGVFLDNGIDEVLEKDLEEKQPVGKPAITNAEAVLLRKEADNTADIVAEQLSQEQKTKKTSKKKSEETVV